MSHTVADPGFGQGGPIGRGSPTLKREGCTPDFIQSYSLLGAKQHKNFGAGGARASAPWIRYWHRTFQLFFRVTDKYKR